MFKINELANCIKFALFTGAAAIVATSSVYAQEKNEAQEIEKITVTGSKIKRQVEEEGAQPVQVLTRADIEKTGLNNVYEILNSITSSDGSGLSTVTTQTNGSDGSQQISLRGLGSQRTLVLVDGRRWATDIDGTVDFSTIPVAIIQRIEILKDGASAIYGSDAIAGVINIVTRKDYDGAQAGLYYGQTAKSDGARKGADITIGSKGERSNTVFSISHTSQESIFAGDREISAVVKYGNNIYGYAGGDCQAILAGAPDPDGLGTFCGSSFGIYGGFGGAGITGTQTLNRNANLADGIQTSDFHTFNNTDRYNFAPINYLQQPAKRTNVFAAGSFDLTDNLSAFVRASYTKRTSDQQLAEVPLSIRDNGTAGPAWDFAVAADSVFNPFGVAITSANYRMQVAGPRHNFFDFDIFSLQTGLEGSFSLGDRAFNWELVAQRNDGQYDQRGENYINLLNLRQALGPSFADATGLHCGVVGAPIAGCTPFGITLGPTAGVGAVVPRSGGGTYTVTQADVDRALAYITYTLVDQTGITSLNYSGNVSAEIFELPGGMFSFALGFESRSDDIFYQPDALVAGAGSSNNFSEPTKGRTTVDELYLEVVAPILKDVTAFQELELSAAVRKSDYTAEGLVGGFAVEKDPGSPTNRKFGLKWKPIDDLLVRYNWGETFRAPSANDLFGGGAESFPATSDPCNTSGFPTLGAAGQALCLSQGVPVGGVVQSNGQIRSLLGGNALLGPESGSNRTLGFVYSPSWLAGFNISVDYWDIRLTDALVARSPNFILNACYGRGVAQDTSFCAFVDRAPNGEIIATRTSQFNADTLAVRGIDFGLSYNFDTSFGTFRMKWDTTSTINNSLNGSADVTGIYDGSPNWQYRSTFSTNWSKGDFDITWTTRYMSDLAESCFTYCNQRNGDGLNHTGEYAVHDVQFGWKAPWDAKVAIGARNLFGKEPPILTNNTFAHNFDAAYDIPGGAFWYAQYRQDF